MSENPLSKVSKKKKMFSSSKNGVKRFFFSPFFFLQWRATHWAFHHFIISPNIEAVYHSLHDPCLPLLKSCYREGSCYLTNHFFFFLLAKVPLLGACFIWSSNNNNNNTYLHFKPSEQTQNGFAPLSCATTWIMGCFLAGAQGSQVHLIVLVPPPPHQTLLTSP
jgi:hypothetical protein